MHAPDDFGDRFTRSDIHGGVVVDNTRHGLWRHARLAGNILERNQ
jgi:hypothetical protein